MSKKKEPSMNGDNQTTSKEYQPGFFAELWQQVQLLYRLFLDPDVPIYIKFLPIAAVAYLIFPFDFLPDVIPGFGQLDDITILVVGVKMFIEMAPQHVVERYLNEMKSGSKVQLDDGVANSKDSADQDIIDGIILEDESADSSS